MPAAEPKTVPPAAQTPTPSSGKRFDARVGDFWHRITDGLEVNELWAQFMADARTSYRLYSRELPVRPEASPGVRPGRAEGRHALATARGFFWAVLLKLSPARRLLLLLALLLLVFPTISYQGDRSSVSFEFHAYSSLLLLLVLVLEIADRVTMKRDLEIAREIQLWLVPGTPPSLAGLELAFVNRPANTVAGDYYDVFPRTTAESGHGNYLIAVADVAGKSLPAALLMATFQASLRTLSASGCGLLPLIDGLNRYSCAHSRGGLRFTTAFLAEFTPETGELTYVNAGHNAPILLRMSGSIERLDRGGLPLGIRENASYESATVAMGVGDVLLVFTDGLIEAVNDRDEEFSEARLLAALMNLRGAAADAITKRVMADVESFVGMAHQHDDITCVVARRT